MKLEGPMKLYRDKKLSISNAHNLVHHDQTIYVEIGWHFINENWESGEICIPYVASKGQLIDFLTKVLSSSTFQSILGKLGMGNIFDPAWGGMLQNMQADISPHVEYMQAEV